MEDQYKIYLEKYQTLFKDHGYQIYVENDRIIIEGHGMRIVGNSVNTFWTAEGVLCRRDYDFFSTEKYIAIDIGLNIGLTTLFLANKKNISKVYGFEPFTPTFAQARKNIDRNSHLKQKIEVFDFGISNKDGAAEINYNPERPGAMSSVRNRFENIGNVETISLRKASKVIGDILEKHKEKTYLKMDCEGAELEILEDLQHYHLLDSIDLIVLEYHFSYPHKILKILQDSGFLCFIEETVLNELGMIRAVKIKDINE